MANTALTKGAKLEAHPEEKRYEVARLILSTGNKRLASEMSNIPLNTIRAWEKTPWWPNVVEEIKREQRSELTSRLGKITQVALEIMEDRLENGEFILNNKTGELIRKPVGLRDANQTAQNLLTQRIKLEELNEKVSSKEETVNEVLKQLATEFSKFTRKKDKAVDVPFVEEVTDAVHEERKA